MSIPEELRSKLEKLSEFRDIVDLRETFWLNPEYKDFETAIKKINISENDVSDASARLERFAPYIAKVFPETKIDNGIIESPLKELKQFKDKIENSENINIGERLLLKCDSHLPISGSIKARGGIYEVLKHAESLALKNNILDLNDNYKIIDSDKFRNFYSKYSIAVGSTGNLGLSIGIMSAKLGFKVYVHMSADAKQWKKDLLRKKGVNVIEYKSDYSRAVVEGRKQTDGDPNMHFIDDENSLDLFLGYAVAASRLKKQFESLNVNIGTEYPLFVYLPCGVGGGPGGVAFGLKLIFKDSVQCFFAEPTHAPCMTLGLMSALHDKISVADVGIDGKTAADGLAVGRPSGFVGKTLCELISGCYTVDDRNLYRMLTKLADNENIYIEPSAAASLAGPIKLLKTDQGNKFLSGKKRIPNMQNAVHLCWATGGSMVPEDEMQKYYNIGK